MKKSNKLYFVFISTILFLLFNFPFIEIVNKQQAFQGIPILLIYLFTLWALCIFVLYSLSKKLFKLGKENE